HQRYFVPIHAFALETSSVDFYEDQIDVRILNNKLKLRSSSGFDVQLYDLTGRLVCSIQHDVPAGTSEIDLDASSLPAGCYWYVVRGNGWSKSGKVMKLP